MLGICSKAKLGSYYCERLITLLALNLYYIARANVLTLIEIPSDRDIHHGGTLPKGAERKRLDLGFFFLLVRKEFSQVRKTLSDDESSVFITE